MSVTPVGDLEALRRQIAATHTRFAALGARLAQAAEAVTTAGAVPPAALLREIHDAAQEFHAVRAAVLDVAASLELVPSTPIRLVTSLHALAPLMDAVVAAAELAARRRRLDAARAEACVVLNRVSAIVHRDDPAFRPLAACHRKAGVLRAALVAADGDDVDAQLRAWARATAPYAALLDLLDGPEGAADAWASELEAAVAAAFGRALAAAAARGTLVIA
jgi:hypothetical protein